jgi:uncharacterized membrane protein
MRTLYLAAVLLHVLAAMVWIGGMVVVAGAVLPQVRRLDEPHRSKFQWEFFGRFRTVMWPAFIVVGVTGALTLALRGVTWLDLAESGWRATPFGHVVTLKMVCYLAGGAITLAHERARSHARARLLGRLSLGIGLLTVLLAVMLVRGA